MNLRMVPLAFAISAATLAGCAAQRPQTNAMGAGRACDLRIDVGAEHGCRVAHVTPPDAQGDLLGQMRDVERQTRQR